MQTQLGHPFHIGHLQALYIATSPHSHPKWFPEMGKPSCTIVCMPSDPRARKIPDYPVDGLLLMCRFPSYLNISIRFWKLNKLIEPKKKCPSMFGIEQKLPPIIGMVPSSVLKIKFPFPLNKK